MRIGFDARLYTQTGVGRYIRNILEEYKKLDTENEFFIYLLSEDLSNFHLPNARWHKMLLDVPWHTFSEQLAVPKRLLLDQLDVAHFPYFNVPIFYPKKYLLTIHDLIVDHFDTGRASTLPAPIYKVKRIGYQLASVLGIRRATAITVISKTTRDEVRDHYHIEEGKLHLTYDALDGHFIKTLTSYKGKKRFSTPYILYVGNAYPHKNLEKLIQAFKILRKQFTLQLVLAGDDAYFYPKLRKYTASLGLAREVIFFGEANDRQLVDLYTHARCLVFPSLMEGFGLPNLEALACNCLPVVSDIPVFKEIWESKLSYFNPYDSDDMVMKITHILSLSKGDYVRKVSGAAKISNNYSWEKTAERTLQLYETICTTNV